MIIANAPGSTLLSGTLFQVSDNIYWMDNLQSLFALGTDVWVIFACLWYNTFILQHYVGRQSNAALSVSALMYWHCFAGLKSRESFSPSWSDEIRRRR